MGVSCCSSAPPPPPVGAPPPLSLTALEKKVHVASLISSKQMTEAEFKAMVDPCTVKGMLNYEDLAPSLAL